VEIFIPIAATSDEVRSCTEYRLAATRARLPQAMPRATFSTMKILASAMAT
jgi:hypothetical protein